MADDEALQAEQDNGPGRPDWLPENFDSPEALVKSYREATGKINDQGRELNELRSEFDQISELIAQQPPAQQQYADPNQHPLVRQYAEAYENGDAAQMLAVQAQLTQAVIQEQLQAQQQSAPQQQADDPTVALLSRAAEAALREKYPDFDEFVPQIKETLNAVPGLVPELTLPAVEAGFDRAYRIAKADSLMQNEQNSAAQAAAAEADRQSKLAATGLMGGGSRQAPVDEAHQHMQDLINMRSNTFSELLNDARK